MRPVQGWQVRSFEQERRRYEFRRGLRRVLALVLLGVVVGVVETLVLLQFFL